MTPFAVHVKLCNVAKVVTKRNSIFSYKQIKIGIHDIREPISTVKKS